MLARDTPREVPNMLPHSLRIQVLGSSSCTPEPGGETACFRVDDSILVDTGWCVARRLTDLGVDPRSIKAVLLTHCHHDHFMGLVSLLFHIGLHSPQTHRPRLHVFGPAGEVERVVEDAWRFLQIDRYPHLGFPVETGDLAHGEEFHLEGLKVTVAGARHNVPGVHLRLENPAGASVVFSGDTAFSPALVELARDCDLLVHEASHGPSSTAGDPQAVHSGAPDAANVALQAGARRLALVHLNEASHAAATEAARAIFDEVFVPRAGDVIEFRCPRAGRR